MSTSTSSLSKELGLLPPTVPFFFFPKTSDYANVEPKAHGDKFAFTRKERDNSAFKKSSKKDSGVKRNDAIVKFSRKLGTLALGFGSGGFGGFFGGAGAAKAVALYPLKNNDLGVSSSEKKTKNVLILMSNTGGGHKASAEALKDSFEEKYGDEYKIDIIDLWKEHTPPPVSSLPDSYSFMVKHSTLWKLTYELTNPRIVHIPYLHSLGLLCRQGINQALDKYRPDLVVSVHPLMQHIPIRVLRQRIRQGVQAPSNFATVVTDFTTCHNTWFSALATRCFVPTDFTRRLAKRMGVADEQLIMHGLPIRPVFSKPLPSRATLRDALGLLPDVPAVLLVGGGEGMGRLQATVAELNRQIGAACQVVVICGRNRLLQEQLEAEYDSVSGGGARMHVVPRGFVNNLHEYMAACDVIVTKAGPGTVAEALISGLPILLNGFIPCQEEGNIPYVLENGVGAFEEDPTRIAEILKQWLSPEFRDQFAAMGAKAKALGRPESVYRIVEDLAKLADAPDFRFGPATAVKKL